MVMLLETFLDLWGSTDANEAEVYSLLIGCCELERIGGSHPNIDGHSFLAIQCGSGKAIRY